MDMFRVGVRYQPLGDDTANEEAGIYKRHWVLVFTGTEYAFTMEAGSGPGKQQDLVMEINPCPVSYPAFYLGIFYGKWSDLPSILKVHPQRGSSYSTFFNNCQHFVAIYLLLLEAFCNEARGRRFIIRRDKRYAGIRETLILSGRHVCNTPNTVMAILNVAAGVTTVGAAFRAVEDTVSAASEFMGWPDVMDSLITSPPFVDFPTFTVPIAVGLTGLAAGAFFLNAYFWSQKTLFRNPKLVGYPRGPAPSLRIRDHPIDWDTMAKLISSNSNKASARQASAVITQEYFSNRGDSERDDVFYLFNLAGKLIK